MNQKHKLIFCIILLVSLVGIPTVFADAQMIKATFVIPVSADPFIYYSNPTTAIGIFSQDFIEVNVSVDSDTTLDNVTIYLYNSSLHLINTSTSTGEPLFVNFTSLPDGVYYINATAKDINDNNGSTATRQIILDQTSPNIIITSPENITYSYIDILVNFTAIDENLDDLWYYNTTVNISYTTPVYESLEPGSYTFFFYANDTAGNLDEENITFSIIHTNRVILDYSNFVTGNLSEVCIQLFNNTLCFNATGIS